MLAMLFTLSGTLLCLCSLSGWLHWVWWLVGSSGYLGFIFMLVLMAGYNGYLYGWLCWLACCTGWVAVYAGWLC
jgi:hypothetical protein